jgi:hypothetical protein
MGRLVSGCAEEIRIRLNLIFTANARRREPRFCQDSSFSPSSAGFGPFDVPPTLPKCVSDSSPAHAFSDSIAISPFSR